LAIALFSLSLQIRNQSRVINMTRNFHKPTESDIQVLLQISLQKKTQNKCTSEFHETYPNDKRWQQSYTKSLIASLRNKERNQLSQIAWDKIVLVLFKAGRSSPDSSPRIEVEDVYLQLACNNFSSKCRRYDFEEVSTILKNSIPDIRSDEDSDDDGAMQENGEDTTTGMVESPAVCLDEYPSTSSVQAEESIPGVNDTTVGTMEYPGGSVEAQGQAGVGDINITENKENMGVTGVKGTVLKPQTKKRLLLRPQSNGVNQQISSGPGRHLQVEGGRANREPEDNEDSTVGAKDTLRLPAPFFPKTTGKKTLQGFGGDHRKVFTPPMPPGSQASQTQDDEDSITVARDTPCVAARFFPKTTGKKTLQGFGGDHRKAFTPPMPPGSQASQTKRKTPLPAALGTTEAKLGPSNPVKGREAPDDDDSAVLRQTPPIRSLYLGQYLGPTPYMPYGRSKVPSPMLPGSQTSQTRRKAHPPDIGITEARSGPLQYLGRSTPMPSDTKAAPVDNAFGGDAPVAKTPTINPTAGRAALFGTSSSKRCKTTRFPFTPAACPSQDNTSANATVAQTMTTSSGQKPNHNAPASSNQQILKELVRVLSAKVGDSDDIPVNRSMRAHCYETIEGNSDSRLNVLVGVMKKWDEQDVCNETKQTMIRDCLEKMNAILDQNL
jgi:hypothetical protein